MNITVSTHLLLSLAHVIDYGLAFNRYNAMLYRFFQSHLKKAGGDIDDLLDPFPVYDSAYPTLRAIYKLTGVSDNKGAVNALRKIHEARAENNGQIISRPVSVDKTWFADAAHQAITRYNERHILMILGGEYHDDLVSIMGEQAYRTMHDEFLNSSISGKLPCGNADFSIKLLNDWLSQEDRPYERPPLPYLQKHHERYRSMREAVRHQIEQMERERKTERN